VSKAALLAISGSVAAIGGGAGGAVPPRGRGCKCSIEPPRLEDLYLFSERCLFVVTLSLKWTTFSRGHFWSNMCLETSLAPLVTISANHVEFPDVNNGSCVAEPLHLVSYVFPRLVPARLSLAGQLDGAYRECRSRCRQGSTSQSVRSLWPLNCGSPRSADQSPASGAPRSLFLQALLAA